MTAARKEFVRELYRRLRGDGISCFFDAELIGWGENWLRALEHAIDECEQKAARDGNSYLVDVGRQSRRPVLHQDSRVMF